MDSTAFSAGDPVNWDFGGSVMYGFLEDDIHPMTPKSATVTVRDLQRGVWQVELAKLRPTE